MYTYEEVVEMARESGFPVLPEVAEALDELHGWTERDWPEVFAKIERAKEAVEHLEREAVRLARLEGVSWEDIGTELGITGQGARKRYGRTELEELDALDELHEAEIKKYHADTKLAIARAREELRSSYDSDEELNKAARDQVLQGKWEGFWNLLGSHSQARSELARKLRE